MDASGLNCTTFCCSALTSQPSPPGCSGGSWVTRYGGKGWGDYKQKTALQSICCRGDAPAPRWRIRCLNGETYRAGRWSGLNDARESDGISMDELLSSRKGSSSQSKRGLREASGGLGLRPQSNQGKTPFHRSMHRSRSWERILSNFLFLQEKT